MGYGIKLRVWGDYACFTRPEFKVERVSYDVITPSAARGIIECIYWKPAIAWIIDKITVINHIEFGNIKLNEIKNMAKLPKGDFSKIDGNKFTMYTTIEDGNRVQRNMMYLKKPEYIIEAHFEVIDKNCDIEEESKKHYNIALRRLKEGQVFRQPCLGLRDFSAFFEYVDKDTVPKSKLEGERDLGFMLYDMAFKKDEDGNATNNADPIFYRPIMKDGIIDVAHYYKNTARGGGKC